jgi:hypothetical protein
MGQDWKDMDGATAFHLIERHAEDWADVGRMMGQWLAANAPAMAELARLTKQRDELVAALKGMVHLEEEGLRGYDDIDVCYELTRAREALASVKGGA